MTSVSIIIPVFGPELYLTACLSAIKEHTEGYEIIAVDNATGYDMDTDVVIRNPDNRGFSEACNIGAKAATAPILCFLNMDTEVQSGWLQPLLDAFSDPSVAIAGPKLIYPSGAIQCAGIRTWHGNGSAGGENRRDEHPSNSDEDGVTGACLAIRRDVFDAIGGWNEAYRLGYDDVEMCLTVRDRGDKIAYVAESVVMHHESACGPERWQFSHANVALMNSRWGNR